MGSLRQPMSVKAALVGASVCYWLLQIGVAALYIVAQSDRGQIVARFLEHPGLDLQSSLLVLASLAVYGLGFAIMVIAGHRMRDMLGQVDFVGIAIILTAISLVFHLAIVAAEIPGAISVLSAFPR